MLGPSLVDFQCTSTRHQFDFILNYEVNYIIKQVPRLKYCYSLTLSFFTWFSSNPVYIWISYWIFSSYILMFIDSIGTFLDEGATWCDIDWFLWPSSWRPQPDQWRPLFVALTMCRCVHVWFSWPKCRTLVPYFVGPCLPYYACVLSKFLFLILSVCFFEGYVN